DLENTLDDKTQLSFSDLKRSTAIYHFTNIESTTTAMKGRGKSTAVIFAKKEDEGF
ncbi:hypothetical protein L195_g046410, partial [Trifolium pratense]